MPTTIEPEPTGDERDAILDALAAPGGDENEGWTATALLEGADADDRDP